MAPASNRAREGSESPDLPLDLPSPTADPGRIKPETSVPCMDAFDSEDWVFEIDWDGSRALMFTEADSTSLQSETLKDVTAQFPELGNLHQSLDGRRAVVDGVVAVLDPKGGPDLEALMLRMSGIADASHIPVVFLATDLLYLDGKPLLKQPLSKRRDQLFKLVWPDARIQVPEWLQGDGTAFADAVAARGLDAVLARRLEAPYRPGIPSPDRLRIALSSRTNTVIMGASLAGESVKSLWIGEYVDGTLREVGEVTKSWATSIDVWLRGRLEEYRTHDGDTFDVRPGLVATVRYQGREIDGHLKQPTCVALREDVEPSWCVWRSAVLPPDGANVERKFAPTVIPNLPLLDPTK